MPLPAFAALGKMLAPALLYVALNENIHRPCEGGAVPTGTDFAVTLGALALLGYPYTEDMPRGSRHDHSGVFVARSDGSILLEGISKSQMAQDDFMKAAGRAAPPSAAPSGPLHVP